MHYYWVVGGGLAIGYAMMRGSDWQGSAQLHTLMEGIATFLALMVGVMSLVRFYSGRNSTFLFIGTGFLGTSLLDGYHAVVTSTFFASHLPSDLPSLIPWSWVASRLFLSIFLCFGWFAWAREQRLGEAGRVSQRMVYWIAGLLIVVSFLFFGFTPLPQAHYPEFVFHRPEEFVPALFFLIALVGYLHKGKWKTDAFENWLVLALVISVVSQVTFMSFSGQLFDLEFDAAHLLKKLSYTCVLTGLFLSMYAIFRQGDERKEELQNKTSVLSLTQSVASDANVITDTDEFIKNCLDNVCRFTGWPVGHAYRTRGDSKAVLYPTKIWHFDDPAPFDPFRLKTERTSFASGVGLPGRVMASGAPAWILDATKDKNFPRAAQAAESGLKGSFAFPVHVLGECTIVLEFFSCREEKPDQELMRVIANVAEQITRRLERERADHDLRVAKTEAEQAELLALSAAREATAASQAKSDFLANMSHELRTPLNGMLGFTELIEQESLGPLGHGQYGEFIKIVGQSGRHLLTVINDILDYSKVEAGKLELESTPFELSQVADDTVELLASTAYDKGIEIASFVAPEVPMNLIGDSGRLRQVLLNLTGNAIKFTEQGGVNIEISLEADLGDEAVLRFEISDTGIGIDEKDQEKLFRKFNQADASTTRKYGGTGLGLAISKQLAELMGGEIGVDSHVGQGSTFWFTANLLKQSNDSDRSLEKVAYSVQGCRALVVDDSQVNRLACRKYLEMLGAEVTAVADARAALAALAEAANGLPFDLAIIDHLMPGTDGIELGRIIRADPKYNDLKMVMSSSSNSCRTQKDAQELGFDAALPKPLHRTVILDCLGYLYGAGPVRTDVLAPDNFGSSLANQSLHILVAEDNEINQLLIETILHAAGHRVEVANDGQEAVEAVQKGTYDLILMDVHMPELSGLEATRQIRQMSGSTAEVPIIAVTAAVTAEDREKCRQAGMNDCVSKPINKREFFEKIALWTDTGISTLADLSEPENEASDRELSEEATAALEEFLNTIDDVAGESQDA